MNEGNSAQEHWDAVYNSKTEQEMSWFQANPETSLRLLDQLKISLDANIIDIGGGDSLFAETLLLRGYKNIWVLDISAAAIRRAKARLGDKANLIQWIISDVRDFKPTVEFDCWHDRATFHFLTTKEDVSIYASLTSAAVKKKGYLLIGTFAENGPKKCSGLEIKQYSEETMSLVFEQSFTKLKCTSETHITPFKTKQEFVFCSFQRKQFR